jgi:hypothetical protein
MTTDLDDLLQSRLRDLVDRPEYTSDELEREIRSRADRHRRRRRSTLIGGGLLTVLALSAGAAIVLADGSPEVVTSDASSSHARGPQLGPVPDRPVTVEAIDGYAGPTGTERLVVHFDGRVPQDPPTYVADIEHPDAPGLVYTTQRPDGLKVCADTHWFPGDTGTVDVLIPETWLAPGALPDDVPLRQLGDFPPAKVVWCGPYQGYTQIGIWGPASDDPRQVHADVRGDGTELVVELGSE